LIDAKTAIVVVTYKRKELLGVLFDSFKEMTLKPNQVFVVDNDKDPEVGSMCADTQKALGEVKVTWLPMEKNLGGSGGFSKGVEQAFNAGYDWIWLMDDDVRVVPNALELLQPWMDEALINDHRAIQCSKENFNGEPFYWQYHYLTGLGMLNPTAPSSFAEGERFKPMNAVCFEGGLFHRSVIEKIGLPDPRFFIHWDDTIYGYLCSKVTHPILIPDVLMQRTREQEHLRIGKVRKLNKASDMLRFHTMRNRGYMAQYLKEHNDYKPIPFQFGTALTFGMECIRLLAGNKKDIPKGLKALFKGMHTGRKLRHDSSWRPMQKLE
jgi:rhamnopyranosyl-N-acetylglucosaminyl-diphospho-decaprenol beta-1,3/1,4-galactofuranosyltransferase